MRNSLSHSGSDRSAVQPVGRGLQVLLLIMPLMVVAGRVAYVQSSLADEFAEPWSRTTTRVRAVPSGTGRILTSDGVVLAHDRTGHELQVHYRWLEQPPNRDWLRQQARARLTRSERRDEQKIAEAEYQFLAERASIWDEIRVLNSDVDDARAAIQQRVERIRDAVESRRQARDDGQQARSSSDGVLRTIWHELTTPPKRSVADPLVLKEELDYHTLAALTDTDVQRMLDRPSRYQGFRIVPVHRREYPAGSMAAHVVGFRGPMLDTIDDSVRAAGIDSNTVVGRSGIELGYDSILRGRDGESTITVSRDGVELSETVARNAKSGTDVVLTIDSRIQVAAETAIDELLGSLPDAGGAAAVVMDVHSGALRALASGPRVSPAIYDRPSPDEWAAVRDDPRRPLFHRATQMAIPPGSVFKLASAVAALEGGWDAESEVFCQGYFRTPDRERCALYRNAGYGHDRLRIDDALGVSCNVFFFELCEAVGPDLLVSNARHSGFGFETGVDLPGESAGNVPSEAAFRYPGHVRQFAIGQGQLTATPLQVVRLTAAIANGGQLMRPYLGAAMQPHATRLNVRPATLATLQRGMIKAVHGPSGTARSLAKLDPKIAGKTGSAEVGGDRPSHGWFTGYFPATAPRYAIAVAVEHGGGAGKSAVPLAAEVITAIMAIDGL